MDRGKRMKIKCRYRADADLYEYAGNNMLYDLVKLYGAYIEYINKIDEGAFVAFYNDTKEHVLYRYINVANNEVKNYLLSERILVSSRKLRRIITTESKSFVYSYSWMPLYVEYVINKIFENEILTEYVLQYILNECIGINPCHSMNNKELQGWICKKALIGFQYNFLETVRENFSERKARVAKTILDEINITKIVDMCPNE